MTEDSRNHVRGYGSSPEGAEPTEQIATRNAGGDPSADEPVPPSSAYPSIPNRRPLSSAGRPARPWSAPPATALTRRRDPQAPPGGFYNEPPPAAAPPPDDDLYVAPPPDGDLYAAPPPHDDSYPARPAGDLYSAPPAGDPYAAPPAGDLHAAPPADFDATLPPAAGCHAAPATPADVYAGPPPGEQNGYGASSLELLPEHPSARGASPADTYSMSTGSAERPSIVPRETSSGGPYFAPRSPAGASPWAAPTAEPAEHQASPATSAENLDPWEPQPSAIGPASAAPYDLDAWGPQTGPATASSYDLDARGRQPGPAAPGHADPYEAQDDWDEPSWATPTPESVYVPSGDADQPGPRREVEQAYHLRQDAGSDPYASLNGLPEPTTPRITPTPAPAKPPRRLSALLIGLLAGLLLFGSAGVLAGRTTATATDPRPAPTTAAPAKAQTTRGVFEQAQAALNRSKFANAGLTTIAQGWLPYLSTCARSTADTGEGEKARIRCTVDGMSAFFVAYKTPADRDKARKKLNGQAKDARNLTPGAATPTTGASGDYVEYAYRLTEGGVTRTVAGIWWDDAQTPIAGYLLAYWKDGLGERWEPMRDLWSRYA